MAMLTAYDFTMAGLIDEAGVDIMLVGDSAGMVMAGFETTVYVSMEQMIMHIEWVKRATRYAMIVGDMPFLSYQAGMDNAVKNAGKFLKAGAEGVKLEGGEEVVDIVKRLTGFGFPVMGHLGLTPQSVHKFGGYPIQGMTEKAAEKMKKDAKLLDEAGVFGMVLEKIPASLGKEITESVSCATIGIGAGRFTDGQVLVSHDLLGLTEKFKPKFLRKYLNGSEIFADTFRKFISDIKSSKFPSDEESY
ncbi:3-methyl-2-oxobutanoate hydroxymethyltransferase [candidate division KSB1 bacterium]